LTQTYPIADRSLDQTNQDRQEKLLRQLKLEEQEALGYAQSEITGQQIDALKRYYGERYGDEEEGSSQVVTRELFETIQWSLADMMRVFASGANILTLEETTEEESKYAKDAADYLNWILLSDNRGRKILYNFFFDGLLHRNGWLACYWRDAEHSAPQELTGLTLGQVQQVLADSNVQIIKEANIDGADGTISLTVRRVKTPPRAEIVSIAPEDMRVNGRCPELEQARYIGRVLRMLRGEALQLWPHKADEIENYAAASMDNASTRRAGDVRQVRFKDNTVDVKQITEAGMSMQIEIMEEYLRVDLDDDGYPETIRCFRMGDCILEEEEVEENPFGMWSPLPVPHRLYGQSFDDIVSDLQRRNTVLTRSALNAVYQSVVNREAFDTNKVNLDSLTATYSGAKVAVDGPPGDAILPLTGGLNTATVAWEALNQSAVTLENRTGSTRQTQGTDPDALLKGAHSGKAIDLLQTAGAARKELTARHAGEGLEDFISKLYRLVCRHQDQPKQAKVGGKFCVFDPRNWNSDLKVRVHTGLGTGNRDQTLMGVQWVSQFQQAIVEKLGPDNPMVTPAHIYRTFEEGVRTLGWHSADAFMNEPQDVPVTDQQGQPVVDPQTGQPATKPWAPPPQPSPEMAKVQADAQMAQATHQLKTQEAQASLQLQSQKDAATLQAQEQKAALDLQLAREKAAADIDLANRKADAEIQLAWAKFQAEQELAREKMLLEAELAREKIEAQHEMHETALEADQEMHSESLDSDVKIATNRPGGALDE
jgi:hypothetical protein